MDYDEAVEATVSRQEAVREIRAHGHDPEEFFSEVGDREEYRGAVVLRWLGY